MDLVPRFSEYVAKALEGLSAAIIAFAAIQAVFKLVKQGLRVGGTPGSRRAVWLDFAVWLLLSLEFQLAADVARTAGSPTWTRLGQLGVVAALRIALNYVLERDLEKADRRATPTRP